MKKRRRQVLEAHTKDGLANFHPQRQSPHALLVKRRQLRCAARTQAARSVQLASQLAAALSTSHLAARDTRRRSASQHSKLRRLGCIQSGVFELLGALTRCVPRRTARGSERPRSKLCGRSQVLYRVQGKRGKLRSSAAVEDAEADCN